jgi:flagellar hook-basal body complex protein FliE
MSMDTLKAAQIYAQVAQAAGNAPRTEEAAEAVKPNFAGMVQSAVETTQESLKAGDAAAASVAAGDASLVDVVTAVSAAEVSLEAAISIRNRVIEAYQEILRMPI